MALTDGLVAYWPLQDNGIDFTLRNNDLTNVGASFVPGKVGNGADLEAGESDYLWRADNADLSMGDIDMSIVAWVNPESGALKTIVSKYGNLASEDEYLLWLEGTTVPVWYVYNTGGASYAAVTGTALPVGAWSMIAVTHDATANQIGISVNGGALVTAAWTFGIRNGVRKFRIGAAGTTSDSAVSYFFDGIIDEVGIWKRVLSAAELVTLYNGGAGLAYPFGGTGGTGFPAGLRSFMVRGTRVG